MMKRVVAIGALVVGLLVALATTVRSADHALPHERASAGRCASCHERAPGYHLENDWDVAHGHAVPELVARCRTCHAPATCIGCHEQAPTTHMAGFLRPVGDDDGARLHTLLGAAHPAACVVCHESPSAECQGCHRVSETRRWLRDAEQDLAPWRSLLEGR